MLIAYLTFSGLTLATVLKAFLKDRHAPKTEATAWIFIFVTAAIWPITLPFIISSKVRAANMRNAATVTHSSLQSTQTQEG